MLRVREKKSSLLIGTDAMSFLCEVQRHVQIPPSTWDSQHHKANARPELQHLQTRGVSL